MRPSFHPRLVNGPFDDPALFIPLTFRNRALLFDLGDLGVLSSGDILKTSHIFVTHTHMDHFAGFDQVLRLLLGRPKVLHLYGPQGFLDNVAGKLSAYSWNLVHNYTDALVLRVTEIRSDQRITQSFRCQAGFKPSDQKIQTNTDDVAHQEPALQVTLAQLDHHIPCLGFAVKEQFHVNILKPRLDSLGLAAGPWITAFKTHLHKKSDPNTSIEVPCASGKHKIRSFRLGPLAEQIARITPGQKVAYVVDAVYSPANENSIIALALEADHLFIEAAFLDKDRHIAKAKYHLTARQAGIIAHKARVRQMTIFHHSPRYMNQAHLLQQEAQEAFKRGD